MFEIIGNRPIRCGLATLGLVAALSCSSEDDPTEPELATITVEGAPATLGILRGESASFTVTVTRNGDFTGTVELTVLGAPAGVTGIVSEVQTTGSVTTATVTIEVQLATAAGTYSLMVRGGGPGIVPATAQLSLTVIEVLLVCPMTGQCEQWATGAIASSEYTATDWSAEQATGHPDVIGCFDDERAWASVHANGIDWLELYFPQSVRPTEIQIFETYGVSSIVQVEIGDGAGSYQTVYNAQAGAHTCPRVLSIPVTNISTAIQVVRLSIDQRSLNDWNEIDAVKLIGTR